MIRNDLPFTVTYQYKLGKGVWITKTLPPGHAHQYSIALPAPKGLDPTITLHWCDSTTKARRITYSTTPLCMWGTNTPANGWLHRFILVNDGTKIHLTK